MGTIAGRPIVAGTMLGVYEVSAPLGAGGMGEVYRARDTKLGRSVAIKLLPSAFCMDPERLARFEREARVLASLNHPHIAQIYGLEGLNERGENGADPHVPFIVMELVDGETLADRIRRGPIAIGDALAIARQIAAALDAAHEKGIVHRDLKPSNIALTHDGAVKILDFGLAKDASVDSGTDLTHSPTMAGPTATGVLLGTAPYMSPEQARGKTVDKRTDIWAFGCVLYEMMTGARAFGGETTTDTVAVILERQPDWTVLPTSVPPHVRSLLRRCLEKDVRRRLRDIGDAQLDDPASDAVSQPLSPARVAWPAVVIAAAVAAAAGAWVIASSRRPASPEWPADGATLSIDAPMPASGPASLPAPGLAVSRDGRSVAWVATTPDASPAIWVYSLATGETRQLAGTEGAANPFWSPDGRMLGFQAQGSLKTIDLANGSIKSLAIVPEVSAGGTWSADNIIVFSARYTLSQIPASGGEPRVVATLNPEYHENSLRYPRFLPDGRHFLYVARSGRSQESGAYLGSLDSKPSRLFAATSHVSYAAPGYILYANDGSLAARAFDPRTFAVGRETFTIANRIGANAGGMNGHFDVSQNGVLAYFRESTVTNGLLRWFDRSGRRLEEVSAPAQYTNFRISPDGRRIAVDLANDRVVGRDVWIMNGAGPPTRVTFGGSDDWQPFWSPDGRKVAFMSYRNGVGELFVKALDGAAPEQPLPAAGGKRPNEQIISGDWSKDGRFVAYWSETPDSRGDVWVQTVDGPEEIWPIARTPSNERGPRISPDARFVAYESDESGQVEIYIQPLPPTGGKWQVSVGGGREVRWRGDGRELFYISRAGTLLAVPVTLSPGSFAAGTPVPLFAVGRRQAATSTYEVTADGQRFLVREPVEPKAQPIMVVLNWAARLPRS